MRVSLPVAGAATLGLVASLAPSLIPRGALVQGVLSGVSMAALAGVALAAVAVWRALGLREWRAGSGLRAGVLAGLLVLALVAPWQAGGWQDQVRGLFGQPPTGAGHPATVAAVALAVFGAVAGLALGLFWLVQRLARGLSRRMPPRVAVILGVLLGLALVWTLANGVLVAGALRAADNLYREIDLLVEDGIAPPVQPERSGSAASAVPWDTLGRAGREMIAAGPDAAAIAAFTGRPAREPIRVYVGLGSAPDAAARADLALAELIRTGAFDRAVLVIHTPTGTGWIDPEGQPALEYLTGGDVATVAVQYSYLSSPLALLTAYDAGAETAEAVFDRVYGHWTALPRDARPRLYLHGLSLGSYYSDLSADLFKMINDPFAGAFWVGPPYSSRTWRQVTAARVAGSPAWLPRFRDGSLIRFTAQTNALDNGHAPWGGMRIVYLQYASDPVTFFDPDAWWRAPPWMAAPRGPDVSPGLRWVPLVTQLQLGLDMALATATPLGHGHVYAAAHYIDGWRAMLDPEGWTDADIARLKAHLAAR